MAILASASTALAATDPDWALVASPSSLTVGVATNVGLKATNTSSTNGDRFSCLKIVLPAEITVSSTSVTSPSGWSASSSGSGPTTVTIRSTSGRIDEGKQLAFTIRVAAEQAGTSSWVANVYQNGWGSCSNHRNGSITLSIGATSPPPPPTPPPGWAWRWACASR